MSSLKSSLMTSFFRSLFTANERIKTEYCNLQTDYKTLKTENNQMKLRSTEMQGNSTLIKDIYWFVLTFNVVSSLLCAIKKDEKSRTFHFSGWLADGKEQMTLLDVENTKITNRCEVLHQLNLSLEEDRKSLMSQVMIMIMMIMMIIIKS